MKEIYGYGLLVVSAAVTGGVCGFLYGWFCGVVARTNEQLEHQRAGDMKLWSRLGPAVAIATFVGCLYNFMVWYGALGYAAVGWVICICARGGIYLAISRRIRKNIAEDAGFM